MTACAPPTASKRHYRRGREVLREILDGNVLICFVSETLTRGDSQIRFAASREKHHEPSAFGSVLIENRRPRPGINHGGMFGHNYLGRFAAGFDCWQCEDAETGAVRRGNGDPLTALARWHDSSKAESSDVVICGYIGYELGYSLLDLPAPGHRPDESLQYPLIQFLSFAEPLPPARIISPNRAPVLTSEGQFCAGTVREGVRLRTEPQVYREHVVTILDHIAAGDIYQANYTQAIDFATTQSSENIYTRVREVCPAPYNALLRFSPVRLPSANGAFIEYPAMSVISASPECFWRKRGNHVETRPIKGTISRGRDAAEDRTRRRRLLLSQKDRAELLMITDLERNDLGRIADVGSVHVPALARIRATPSVWHLESVVSATVADNAHWTDIMRVMFPGGSITGAPKRRAVEILGGLETCPRGVYCGAFGWVDANGDAEFALAIRTAVQIGNSVRIFGGGGIVADSDPESEYEESLIKIAPLLDAILDRAAVR